MFNLFYKVIKNEKVEYSIREAIKASNGECVGGYYFMRRKTLIVVLDIKGDKNYGFGLQALSVNIPDNYNSTFQVWKMDRLYDSVSKSFIKKLTYIN